MKLSNYEIRALRKRRPIVTEHGPVDADELIDRYLSGVSINRLSAECRVPEVRIKDLLKGNGIEIRNKSEAAKVWAA